MARIVGEVRPKFVFVENSPVLTSRGLGVVLGDLAAVGFDAEWDVFTARAQGFDHLRERIWIVAADPSGVNGGRNNTMGRIDEWGGSSNPLRGTVIGSMCLPEFEELVMGWPIGWTALTPYETDKCHEWRQEHSSGLPLNSSEAA
jgi:site-specific DNA-cytosine methylase